jgi:hypothetical protein
MLATLFKPFDVFIKMKSKVQIECRFNYNQSQYNINMDIYLNAHGTTLIRLAHDQMIG